MSKVAKQVKERLDAKQAEARALYKEFNDARTAALESGKNLAEDKDTFDQLHELNRKWSAVADEVNALQENLIKALEIDGAEFDGDAKDFDPERQAAKLEEKAAKAGIWTPGQRLVQSDAYKALLESGELNSSAGVKKGQIMPGIEVANREEFKTLLTGASRTSAGAFIVPDRQPGYLELLFRQLVVRNLVTVGDTDVDLVEWVRETAFTNNAAETAEATATAGASGTKPESGLTYDVVQSTVRTIAHWIPATKRSLADVGQLRTLIDARLQDGVNLRLDSQMINGDGAGENLRGILNTTGVLAQPRGADPAIEAILKAVTAVRLQFLEPDAILMHPTDAMNARLAKNAQGDYYFGPPNLAGNLQVWGLPIVQSPVVPAGTAIVGKWNEAILWVREGVIVSASDSHQDFFIRNMVAVLAEGRFAFAVPRPFAFDVVTGL
jgi:HK97 family phage major capsid protein